jgi:glycosyltransferase involved in cell wall biosynthesis
MTISVIIPVYNAEKYMRKAVESALEQPETGEILLVEDASPDNALQICEELEQKFEKVRLVRHDDLQNHGAGASRNLGIKNAGYNYVAFLDADDFYLKDRFTKAMELFGRYPDIDGVYEAVGVHFDSESSKDEWLAKGITEQVTLTEMVNPDNLFDAIVKGGKGTIHLNGLTVKKQFFTRCGYFFENLKLHQDTALIVQMAVTGKLISGNIQQPVAMRTIHDHNRILNQKDKRYNKFLYWKTLFYWACENGLSNSKLITLFERYIYSMGALARNNPVMFPRNIQGLKPLYMEPIKHPMLFVATIYKKVLNQLKR